MFFAVELLTGLSVLVFILGRGLTSLTGILDTPSSMAMNQQALGKDELTRRGLYQMGKYALEVSAPTKDRRGERVIIGHIKFGYILCI